MADKDTTSTLSPELARVIGEGIAQGLNAVRPQKVPFGRYDPKTPFHPDRTKTPKLTRDCFQNGIKMDPALLHDAEILLLNQIRRSGRYVDRMVEVTLRDEGTDPVVEIRFKDTTIDDRMEFRGKVRNMLDLLEKVIAEQVAIEADEPVSKRRSA